MKTIAIAKLLNVILLLLISNILISCTQDKGELTNISALEKSLILSTTILDNYSKQELSALNEKTNDASFREVSLVWNEKAKKINAITKAFSDRFDSCFKISEDNDFSAIKPYLKTQFNLYKQLILQLDPQINATLSKDFSKLGDGDFFEGFNIKNSKDKLQAYFLNQVSIINNRSISFCNAKASPGCILRMEQFSVLVGQNALHFRSGDFIEINAGVGAYTNAANPKFSIDSKNILPNENFIAEYKRKIAESPGKYSIPVKIDYYSEDGTRTTVNQTIEFYVDQ